MVLEKLQKLKPREKLGLSLAGLVVMILLIDRFAVQPVAETLGWFDQRIASEESEIAYRRSVIEQAPIVSEEYDRASGRIDKLDAEPGVVLDGMRANIDEIARETGLMIGAMEERESVSSEFHETFAVEIGSFDSTLPDLLEFLYKVDTMPGLLRIARLTLDTDSPRHRVAGSMLITKVVMRGENG